MVARRRRRAGDNLSPAQRYGLFLEKADELAAEPLIAEGFKVRLNLRFRASEGVNLQLEQPSEGDFRSALLTLRQFIAQGEPIAVGRVANMLRRALHTAAGSPTPTIRQLAFRLQRDFALQEGLWKTARQSSKSLGLLINGRAVTPEDAADLWINGHYFHTDAARRTRLSALRVQDRIFHRRLFFDFVTATIIYVLNLKALIEAAARDGIIAQPQGSP